MPYSKEYKICFVHIPKTAGTTIEKSLNLLNAESLYSERKFVNKNVTAQHFNYEELKEVLGDTLDQYQIFTVVRNPFDRIVSEYHHVIHNDWATEYKNLSFDEFVKKSIFTDVETRIRIFDAHIEPQTYFIKGCENIKVFKYENLEECFNWIRQIVGDNISFGHERKSERRPYNEYYKNSDTIKLVSEFYKEDLERFSYSF